MKMERTGNGQRWGESLFQTDPLTSVEYFDSLKRVFPLESERRLMLAVLQDAVECYRKYIFTRQGKDKHLFNEAEEWILERDDHSAFSFENVCDSLGLAPNYIRAGLLRSKERLLAQRREQKPSGLDPAPKSRRVSRKRRAA